MQTRSLGSNGPRVSEIGFGAWAIGGGWGEKDDAASLAALNEAIDRGVNFIDTAQGYGNGHSERLIGQVIKQRSEDIFVATKTPPDAGPWPPSPYCRWQDRYSAAYLRDNVHQRLTALGSSGWICCSCTLGRERGMTIRSRCWCCVRCVTKARSG